MILGLLSDSHDRYDTMAAALDLLRRHGATYFIHCGDVGAPRMLDLLAGLPAGFVWGNCDWDRPSLQRYAGDVGVTCFGTAGELEFDGKRLAVTHGDDHALVRKLLDAQSHDYLFTGHTHQRRDDRVGRTRVINPGALHRAAEKTVATLDTATDALLFHVVR